MRVVVVLLVSALFLSGCTRYTVQKYSDIDESDKSVTVPAGGQGLKGRLKTALSNDGWKMVVYGGPTVTEGEIGKKTAVKNFDTFNTRYSLYVASEAFDTCLNLEPAISYDLSLVDNKTGSEVITVAGEGCEGEVVKRFKQALTN